MSLTASARAGPTTPPCPTRPLLWRAAWESAALAILLGSSLLAFSCQTHAATAGDGDPAASVEAGSGTDGSTGDAGARSGGTPNRVSALGRIEPGDGVVDVGAAPGERVASLEVEENDEVEAGAVLATLESYAERLAEREHQAALVAEALLQLRQAQEAGPLTVRALEADVRRLGKNLELAQSDLERFKVLVGSELVTEQNYDHQRTIEAQARESLSHSQIMLQRERQMLELDIASARAQLATARARLQSAEAALARATIRAPVPGRILEIHAREGEPIRGGDLLMMGETERMYAVAEVYETGVRHLKPGQRAEVSSPALDRVLLGTVERIGSMIFKNDVLGVDPTADNDSRIVEVRIRLDENQLASRFIHLQVEVKIEI